MDRVDAFWHEDVLRHDTGAGIFDAEPQDWLEVPETHAENAERVRNMRGILRGGPARRPRALARRTARARSRRLTTLHDADYVAERGGGVRARATSSRARRSSRRAPGRRSWPPPARP